MRTYEFFVHIKANNDSEAEKALKELESLLGKYGGVINSKDMKGAHKLAAPINGITSSFQAVLSVSAKPETIAEFRKQANLLASILRVGIFEQKETSAAA